MTPPGERALLRLRPHPLFVLLWPLRTYASIVALWAAGVWAGSVLEGRGYGGWLASLPMGRVAAASLGARFVWAVLEWLAREYVLTERRVSRTFGVLSRRTDEVKLADVRSVAVAKPIEQRIFGLGTLGFASAATGEFEVSWPIVARPRTLAGRVRAAIDGSPAAVGEAPA